MKVLHILHELRPSGAEVMLRTAARYWGELGVNCEILATGPNVGPFAPDLERAGYRIHYLKNTRNLRFIAKLSAFIRREGYTVVHQHSEGMSFWFGLAALMGGARVVRTIHSNFDFNGFLRIRRGIQRRLLAAMGVRYVSIGASVQRNELERFRLKTKLINNWADLESLSPPTPEERAAARNHLEYKDDDFVVLTVGNCTPGKNHTAVIKSMTQCKDIPGIKYLHVGIEDAECTERQLVEQLGLANEVKFTGWMPSPKAALYAADVFVMPSLFEGFPIAALEAASTGVASILADSPGLVDLKDEFPGLLYATPNVDSISNAIRKTYFSIKSNERKQSTAWRAIVLSKFGPQRGVQEYVSVYQTR